MKMFSCALTKPMCLAVFLMFLVSFSFPWENSWAMSTAPKLPRPDAVNLQVKKHYSVKPDGSYTMTLFVKTLINTYKGKKDRGDFRFGYNSAFETVKVKRARTILADGRVVEVGQKEMNDIADPATQKASIFSGARVRIINFPAVEKGCTVELEIEKGSRLGFWGMESFALLDPCLEKTVTMELPEDMPLNFQLLDKRIKFSQHREKGRKILEWKGEQLEKAADDPLSPPIENLDSTLVFSSFASWKQVGAWFRNILVDKGNKRAAFAHDLDAAPDPDSLYSLLSERLEILPLGFFQTRLHFQKPGQTFKKRYGTQIDAALLFYRILESRGLNPLLLAASSRGIWLKGLKNSFCPQLFDTFVVRAGKRFYSFDAKDMSPGVTGMDGQQALELSGGEFETVTDIRPTGSQASYQVHLADPSRLEFSFKTRQSGTDARSVRKMFKDLTPSEMKVADSMFFHSLNPLAEPLSPLKKTGLDPRTGPVEIKASYSAREVHVPRGDSYVLAVPRISKLDGIASCPEKRKAPFFIRKKESLKVEYNLSLPDSCKVTAVPADIQGEAGPISWENRCRTSDHGIFCVRKVTIQRGLVSAGEEFLELRSRILKLIDPEENSLAYWCSD